jgi:4-aminobutyrate aminotransferase-like enzyme
VRAVPAPTGDAGEEFAAGVRAAIADLAGAGIRPAALLVDTIFSSDGVFADPPGFLVPAVAEIRAAGGLFIADEVQPGFGRTGAGMWGFSRHGLEPDLVTMGKPMGDGHPIAAMAGRPELLARFGESLRYFNTFGGNPVSCAAGMAVLDVIEGEGLIAAARRVGARLKSDIEALAKHQPAIAATRGAGLYLGVDIVDDDGQPSGRLAGRIVNALRSDRILISATGRLGHTLKIRPPLVFAESHAVMLVEGLERALHRVAAEG